MQINNSTEPLVSVVISCYNQQDCIKSAVMSVLNQTHSNLEIIIIDDCSKDDSFSALEKLASIYSCIKIFRNKNNRGISFTRSRGFNLAEGKFVTYLDGDDIYYPEKLEKELALFSKNPTLDVVFSNFIVKKINEKEYKYIDDKQARLFQDRVNYREILFDGSLIRFEMIKRESLININLYNTQLKVYEDWDFRIRYSRVLKVGFNSQVSSEYIVHPSSLSGTHHIVQFYKKRVLEKHFRPSLPYLSFSDKIKLFNYYLNSSYNYSKLSTASRKDRLKNLLLFAFFKPWRIGAIYFSLQKL